jgi:hypothetical protein
VEHLDLVFIISFGRNLWTKVDHCSTPSVQIWLSDATKSKILSIMVR